MSDLNDLNVVTFAFSPSGPSPPFLWNQMSVFKQGAVQKFVLFFFFFSFVLVWVVQFLWTKSSKWMHIIILFDTTKQKQVSLNNNNNTDTILILIAWNGSCDYFIPRQILEVS